MVPDFAPGIHFPRWRAERPLISPEFVKKCRSFKLLSKIQKFVRVVSLLAVYFGVGGIFMGSSALAGPGLEITPEEYASYYAWMDGKEDPRLAEFSEEVKMKKIAKQEKLKVSDFKARVDKVTPIVGTIKPENQSALRNALDQTVLKSRIREIEISTSSAYVVAYVKWECGDKRDIDKEAAYVAWAAGQGGKIIKVLGLWCVNSIDTKLYSAQIGRESFTRVKKSSVERFAVSRYARMFEKVKRGPHR